MKIRFLVKKVAYNALFIWPSKLSHQVLINRIRSRGQARVVFFASNLSMWRYQSLMEMMMEDARFEVRLIIAPFKFYSEELSRSSVARLRAYFEAKGIDYTDITQTSGMDPEFLKDFHPDLLFYPQQYSHMLDDSVDFSAFRNRLVCFYPYGLSTFDTAWQSALRMTNTAWKLFFPSVAHKINAQKWLYGKGDNIVVVGDPDYDRFMASSDDSVWKKQDRRKKRIIWAPHFTISSGGKFSRDSFLWLHSIMLDLAKKHSDEIQIAFKPHPHLLGALYSHPDWGKQRADSYYETWANLPNGQLEDGDFIDLFNTSDALIHDCGSFTAEYLYTAKPVMFVSTHIETELGQLSDFGKMALNAHYHGSSESDVASFIENVVLGGSDTKAPERQSFRTNYLVPPGGKGVAESTYEDIVNSLWG